MEKAERAKRLRLGEQRLQEWQIPATAGVADLDALIGRDTAADFAIAVRLGAIPTAASSRALRRLQAESTDKLLRREVRRSLYRLQQRGIAVEEAPVTAPRPLTEPLLLEGFLSPIDGRGDRLIWLTKPRPGGLAHLYAVVNDPDGLKEVDLAETTRKAFRAGRQELAEKHEIRMIPADWHYCDWLIDRALRWATDRGRAGGDYPRLRAMLTKEAPQEEMRPLIFSLLDAEEIQHDTKLIVDSASLLEEKEFRTWFPGPEILKPYVDNILQSRDSPIFINEAQRDERMRTELRQAVQDLFGGEHQSSWVRRLEEMAHYLHVTDRREQAKRALAVALMLQGSTRGGSDIPFCEQLVRASVGTLLEFENRQARERERDSLIVTPQQAAREAKRKR